MNVSDERLRETFRAQAPVGIRTMPPGTRRRVTARRVLRISLMGGLVMVFVAATLFASSVIPRRGEQAADRSPSWPALHGGSWPAQDGWSQLRMAPPAEDLSPTGSGVLLRGNVGGVSWTLDWTSAVQDPDNDEEYGQLWIDTWTVSGPYAQPHAFNYSSDSPGATDGFSEVPRDTPMRLSTLVAMGRDAGFSAVAGVVSPDVARVEVSGTDGVTRVVPLVASPTGRFAYFVFFPPPDVSGTVRAFGLDGAVLVAGHWCDQTLSPPTVPSTRIDITSCSGAKVN